MKKLCVLVFACLGVACACASVIYNDAIDEIDPGIGDGGGTLDIVSVEVSNTDSNLVFALTVNGSISITDFGKFLIGIATGGSGTTNGNGWNRPINLDSPVGGMDYWIGSWVDSGGGAELWSYDGASWSGPGAVAGYTMTPGVQSLLTFTVA
ncbi:MAG: hypothetical protein EOM20_15165, partial [Spartobacteria bacterium]|nr:hypothetical protein [Spartobacteria bacterium]